jgi:hypothetical protein
METAFAVNGGKSRSKDGFGEMKRGNQEGWECAHPRFASAICLKYYPPAEESAEIFRTAVLRQENTGRLNRHDLF